MTEMGDFFGERCCQILGRGDELGNPADFRVVPGCDDDTGSLAIGDHGRAIDHVFSFSKNRFTVKDIYEFFNCNGFAGEGGFVNLQVTAVE